MESIKQRQVAHLLEESLADVFLRHGREVYKTAFVTITKIYVTPDLLTARIYVSIYNVSDKNQVLEQINDGSHLIKRHLTQKIHNKLRRMPVLEFFLDDSLDEAIRLNDLFQRLNTPPATE
ncbi:MAG: 30S ribosome-binding factor RbfA [Sphingobacteriales bacterium]|jgi:ribosome-binding factor A|nr:30S ribosome-binding factor RbfA [Sphingobacteriales bacterium]MBP9141739.1 30S ribosome-binding factor RbfA [Chitinophagales bacterium]MDA0199492.1 30S ribosome-binding factor RbfA [Bacteroidota bacterium]MBK6889405.1 30S ribosome-binding factor RbfA [Sphingobacteriales bacterium]MBK7528095.1 30S ribosome-binding factor RbfA [Sphingobacteriales bacterium]